MTVVEQMAEFVMRAGGKEFVLRASDRTVFCNSVRRFDRGNRGQRVSPMAIDRTATQIGASRAALKRNPNAGADRAVQSTRREAKSGNECPADYNTQLESGQRNVARNQ